MMVDRLHFMEGKAIMIFSHTVNNTCIEKVSLGVSLICKNCVAGHDFFPIFSIKAAIKASSMKLVD